MIKPASAGCDLRCRYCFYWDEAAQRETASFGKMRPETLRDCLENVRKSAQPGDTVTLAFQGGEPTLAGLDFFRSVTGLAGQWPKNIRLQYTLQTNGLHLDEEWCAFLKKHNFLVGISYDLLPEYHDAARVDIAGKGTARRVEAAIANLQKAGVSFNVLCTLTNPVARHPRQVWKRLAELGIEYVQFTPCLAPLEGESLYTLTPRRFAAFYNGLFPLWLADYRAGRYRSVKLFDDVLNRLAYGTSGTCGMGGQCSPQIVVEADGSVYPCDFYCLEAYTLGNLRQSTLPELLGSEKMAEFLRRPTEMPGLCENCRWKAFCGGGCPRMRREVCCAPGEGFCGYRNFLDTNADALLSLAAGARR